VTASDSANWCPKHGSTINTTAGCVVCAVESASQCPHGRFLGSYCDLCTRERVGRFADNTHAPVGDARAQLWARVYAAEYAVVRQARQAEGCDGFSPGYLRRAREAADAAAADFDQHYFGGKP